MMGKIWRGLGAFKNAVGNILFLGILVLLVSLILFEGPAPIPNKAALVLNPTGIIVDQKRPVDPMTSLISGNTGEPPETLLRDILKVIETAKQDDRIQALVLDTSRMQSASLSKLEELGTAIDDFKSSGKPVYAWGDSYSQAQYYLATHADQIYLNSDALGLPGGVFFTGYGSYPTYFKSALEHLKVKIHVFKVGLFKGAVEPYLRDTMSEQSREANAVWLSALWDHYRDVITANRNIDAADFEFFTNRYARALAEAGNDPARLALQAGLIDDLVNPQEWQRIMQQQVGKSADGFAAIELRHYLASTRSTIDVTGTGGDQIAVIIAKGTILDGEQPAGDIGSTTMLQLIQQAQTSDSIKAVVVRVDSPGGSASAAEKIRAALARLRDTGKPVVVSMGTYAASGGYWMSASANRIFASRSTITGSIGAYMLFPTFEASLDTLGVSSDGLGTTTLTSAMNPFMPLNPVFEQTLQLSIREVYRRFIEHVAQGRSMTPEAVDEVAQGRVWTGTDALKFGLIDGIGTLDDAIATAAVLAGTSDYETKYLEQRLTPQQQLVNQLLGQGVSLIRQASGNQSGFLSDAAVIPGLGEEISELARLATEGSSGQVFSRCLVCAVRW